MLGDLEARRGQELSEWTRNGPRDVVDRPAGLAGGAGLGLQRGVPVDHTTICRWVQKYASELAKQTRWHRQVSDWQARSWRVNETYIRVGGKWCSLYRAITAGGHTLDFYLSPKRNVATAQRFLVKTLRSCQCPPGLPG